MSVAEDDTGHQKRTSTPSSLSLARSRNPQEYRDNHQNTSIINKVNLNGIRRQSPPPFARAARPNSSIQNSSNRLVVDLKSEDTASQNDDSPNSTTPSHLNPSATTTATTTTTMRASHAHAAEAVKVPPAIVSSPSGPLSPSATPTNPHPHEGGEESPIKDTPSPTKDTSSPTASNDSTNPTTAVDVDDTPQQSKVQPKIPSRSTSSSKSPSQVQTRPTVTTPASPPPSPPPSAGTAAAASSVTVTVTGMVDSPLTLLSAATVRSNTATPVRGGSLASLLHSAHREVELPESTTANDRRGGEGNGNGTPLSPTSMSQGGTHSRKDSAATMASASTVSGTGIELDTPLKGGAGGTGGGGAEDTMDVDPATYAPPQQQHLPRSGAGSAIHTPTGLGSKSTMTTAALPYPLSRSPQPQPPHHSSPSATMPGSLGSIHRHQASPSPPTPLVSTHPPKSPHPLAAGPSAATAPTSSSHHQRHHSLNRPQHSHSRSYSGRIPASGGIANPSQPLSTPQPRPLSPGSQLRSFARSDIPGPPPPGVPGEDREREYNISASDYDEMRAQLDQLATQAEEFRAQRDYNARLLERHEEQVRAADRHRMMLVRGVNEWMKNGDALLRSLAESIGNTTLAAAAAYNGRGHVESEHDRDRARHGGGATGASLSSAMVGAHREYMEREKTLSVVLTGSPYTPGPHGRPGSSYGPGQDSHPFRVAPTPTHPESASHLSRGTPRPTHHSTGSNSLRRSRRPSSDDLAEHGGKRIKANNGTFIRTSPDAAERASHSTHHLGPLSAVSSIGHALGRTSALGVGRDGTGDFTPYPTSHNRGSGSLGSGTEHGRESPLNRRTNAGREEDEDEFPSPRRSHAVPPGVLPPTGNGHASALAAGRPNQARVAALLASGDDVDPIGSPDVDTTVHESLMELVEDEDAESARRGHGGMSHVRGMMRNGSRSSRNSQDIDEMIAEVADGEDRPMRDGNGVVRPSARPRYRTPGDALSPGHTRSYTPSSQPAQAKFMPTSSAPSAPQQTNSRGFVFRNTDVADMKAQAQARSPEELGHRPSLSGSGSFDGTHTSPPGTSGNPVTTQFLPPQSGPPQPKKIYHSKGTGQVIGSQHVAMMNPTPTMPVDPIPQQPRPTVSTSSLTTDGLPKRTCKQCGQPGRYKDNKCVEKWGPGPQGPGTVCDRCRKKMKRVEKRATQDSAAMNAAMSHHQYPIAPAPSGSFSQLPNQGSQRFEESPEYGFSQATEDAQSQPSLSRARSQNHLPMPQPQPGRRGGHADQSMHRDTTLTYPPHSNLPTNPSRETMPPPTSFTNAYGSPRPSRSSRREPSADTRDGDLDADGDAETDQLMDDELSAAADASTGIGGRRKDQAVKPEA